MFQNPPQNVMDAITECVQKGDMNGYGPSTGHLDAREAVARHISKNPNIRLESNGLTLNSFEM